MTHLIHEDPTKVYACPDCDAAAVEHRSLGHPSAGGQTEFWCKDCGKDIREPRVRKKFAKNTKGRGGRSKLEVLLDQNPRVREEFGTGFETANPLRDGGDV